jgi:hypothetical protein
MLKATFPDSFLHFLHELHGTLHFPLSLSPRLRASASPRETCFCSAVAGWQFWEKK